jgi:hypothetical protein
MKLYSRQTAFFMVETIQEPYLLFYSNLYICSGAQSVCGLNELWKYTLMKHEMTTSDWEKFFQSLQMTYYSLLAAPLFIFAIIFLRAENGNAKLIDIDPEMQNYLVLLVTIIAFMDVVFLHVFYKKRMRDARSFNTVEAKLSVFRKATMFKYIGVAIYQLITIVVFAITYHQGIMALFTGLLLYSSFFRPELQIAKRDLRLSKEEFRQIDYKSEVIE